MKSQVGIEDVINAVHDVLGDKQGAPAVPEAQGAPSQTAAPAVGATTVPETPAPVQPEAV